MARKSFSVLFFIKKAKLLKNGEAPVCMRIIVNGCMVDISIKRSCPVNLWNQAKENSKGKDRMSVELNHYIEIIRSRIHQIYRELETSDKVITVDLVRKLYYGVDEESKTLLQVFREHNEQSRKLIGKDFVSKTVQRYETTTRYLEEFIKKEYQLSDIALNNLEANFISKFDAFLKIEKGCAQNSAITRLKNLKKIIRIALENDWIKKDPFAYYRFKLEETDPEFLTMDEIKIIIGKEFTIKRVEQVRDVFVFCSFTGLAFIDLYNLKEENIKTFFDDGEWIVIHRQKTGTEADIKLLDYPKQIMEKYRGLCKDGRVFPVPPYRSCLRSLKRLGKKCGITKPLSWHVSRHSFATSVCLSNGVPIETVSSMLGHKDIKTTQVYAKITKEKLSKDVEKLSQQLNHIEEFTFGNICSDNTNTKKA